MLRPARLLTLAAALVFAGPALAGQLGGGFIELLMTGRDPTPRAAAARAAAPSAPAASRQQGPGEAEPPAPPRYAALPREPLTIEQSFDPRFERQRVAYDGPHGPGVIVIDTQAKFLYLVEPGGAALRYGIGVGRPGFLWRGVKAVTRKAEWPDWTPPPEMLKRRPDLPRFMPGGIDNPLGARALYLGGSLYRIHGTNEPHTIGHNVSSGCIRLRNEDVVDLYGRVRVGATVVVL